MVAQTLGRRPDGKLRLAIVGLGRMGRLHLRSWQQLAGVTIAALADRDGGRAAQAQAHGVPFFSDGAALGGRVDAAVIATPAAEHAACALPLLVAGVHCLIEKPMATTSEDCARLLAAATRHAAVLAVGHSERFNAGVGHARKIMAMDAWRIEAFRMAPLSDAGPQDADVVQDLMVHDLDWVIDAIGELPRHFKVRAARRHMGALSHVSCELVFADGRQVGLTASRMAAKRQRRIHLHRASGEIAVVDLDSGHVQADGDPLTLQARAFLAAVNGEASGIATGRDVLPVMALGDKIRACCEATDALVS